METKSSDDPQPDKICEKKPNVICAKKLISCGKIINH